MGEDSTALAFLVGLGVVLPLVAWGILRFGRERPVDVPLDEPEPEVTRPRFRPGAVELLRRVGIEGPYTGDASDETYAVHCACVDISNRLYGELGKDAHRSGTWHADAALLAALRDALGEQAGTYAGHDVAYTLVRCGRVSPDIVKALHPLKRMAFAWRESGYTAASIADMLREAGIAPALSEKAIAEIDGWIRDPLSALEQDSSVPDRLLGTRSVHGSLEHSGYEPRHDELFAALAQAAVPPVGVSEARQEIAEEERFRDVTATTMLAAGDAPGIAAVLSDQGSHWIVEYAHAGKAYGFLANCNGTQMDLGAVLRHFDELMARIGHADRVFRLEREDGLSGHFTVAPHETFPALAQRLGIPLHGRG